MPRHHVDARSSSAALLYCVSFTASVVQTGSDDWIAAILFLLDCLHTSSIGFSASSMQQNFSVWSCYVTAERASLAASAWEDRIQALFARVQVSEWQRVGLPHWQFTATDADVKSLGRLLSSSSSTLAVPVTRRATLGDGRPGMEHSTRLRHISAIRLIILHCDEDLSVLQNFLTLQHTWYFHSVACSCSAMRLYHVDLIVWRCRWWWSVVTYFIIVFISTARSPARWVAEVHNWHFTACAECSSSSRHKHWQVRQWPLESTTRPVNVC